MLFKKRSEKRSFMSSETFINYKFYINHLFIELLIWLLISWNYDVANPNPNMTWFLINYF